MTVALAGLALAALGNLLQTGDSSQYLESGPGLRTLLEAHASDARDLDRWLTVGPSADRLDRLDALAELWSGRLSALDEAALDAAGRVDALLLSSHLESGRLARQQQRERQQRLAHALPFADVIVKLEQDRWTLEPLHLPKLAAELDAQVRSVKALIESLPEVTPADALWLARQVSELIDVLSTWREHHLAYDPGFGWWTDAPCDALAEQLRNYAKGLREERAAQKGEPDDPLVGDPIGREALLVDLANAWIAYTPEELVAIGEAQLAFCHEQMIGQAQAMGFADDWRAALAHVKTLHVPPGEQDDLVLALGREAVAFLDERQLVTIPELCRETWRVQMLSTEGQRTLPFAAYGGQHMLVAYPTAEMDHDTKRQAMAGNNVPFTRLVTPHELIPGHHLQGFMAARHATWRRTFSTPFLGEGWALYWEFRFWDLGWGRTPEERMGMLFWRAHRAARIVFSLRFQLGELSAEEAVDLLVDRVGHERDNARAEVRRSVAGDYSPLYQCAYMLGALQLLALRAELVDSGRMGERDFHDAILHQGSLPIELLRALLSGERLPLDHSPSWRFAGDPLSATAER